MKNFNDWLALHITNSVGTMYCAYLFAIIGISGIVAALTNNAGAVLLIGAISGYFLQLVLLPIIIVGQNLQSQKHDMLVAKVTRMHKHVKEIHHHLGINGAPNGPSNDWE